VLMMMRRIVDESSTIRIFKGVSFGWFRLVRVRRGGSFNEF